MDFRIVSSGLSGLARVRSIRRRLLSPYSGSYYYDVDRYDYYVGHNALQSLADFDRYSNIAETSIDSVFAGTITPLNIDFTSTESQIIEMLGKPRFVIENNRSFFDHRVLFFKSKIGGFSFLVQFHFLNEQLWLVKQDISSRAQGGGDLAYINRLLLQKYDALHEISETQRSVSITDQQGNQMRVTHSMNTEIVYTRRHIAIEKKIAQWVKIRARSAGESVQQLEHRILAKL